MPIKLEDLYKEKARKALASTRAQMLAVLEKFELEYAFALQIESIASTQQRRIEVLEAALREHAPPEALAALFIEG